MTGSLHCKKNDNQCEDICAADAKTIKNEPVASVRRKEKEKQQFTCATANGHDNS